MFQQTTPLSNGAESTNDSAAALPSTPRCEESSGILNEVFKIGKSFAFIFNNSYEALPMNYFSFSDYCLSKLDEMRERVRLRNTSNTLRLNHPYYVQAAINASQSSQFMQDVHSKLVIVFKGEEKGRRRWATQRLLKLIPPIRDNTCRKSPLYGRRTNKCLK